MRFFYIFAALALVVSPAPAAEAGPSACSQWALNGVRVDTSFDEIKDRREFEDVTRQRNPEGHGLGYRLYAWRATDRPEKLELHVDIRAVPPRIIGVTITVPVAITPPQDYVDNLIKRWGPPLQVSRQGAFNLYSWIDDECGVSARVTAMNRSHQVGVFATMSSNAGRKEYARRESAAAADEPDGEASDGVPAPDGHARGSDDR